MRIAMILPGQFPPDIRVEKEVGTLQGEHEVFMLCPRRGQQPARENWQGMEIHRVFSRAQRWWSQLNLMTRCYSGSWESAINDFIVDVDADVLHVHDLPLLGPALTSATTRQIPVVADLHENYPAMLQETLRAPLRQIASLGGLTTRLSVSVPRWEAYEKSTVPKADRVITVVEEARERLIRQGVPAANVAVVGNYATLDNVEDPSPVADSTPTNNPSRLRVVYAGAFDATRDLITVLDAIKKLPAGVRSSIDVQLIGGHGRSLDQLSRYASSLGVEDHVTLLEWLPRSEAEQLMNEADVGLVPHVKSPHTDATIPHKLFQYMWRCLPVIVSNCAPLERIVRDSECGLVYRSGDSQCLANCLADMHAQQDRALTFGAAGRRAVRRQYSWNNAGDNLLEVYRGLA